VRGPSGAWIPVRTDSDGTLKSKNYKFLSGQESWTKVCDGSECTITCKIVKDPSLEVIHDYKQVKFEVGEAELYNLPAGIDLAVKKMQRNEIARIGCKLNMAMTDKSFEKIKIEPQVKYFKAGILCYADFGTIICCGISNSPFRKIFCLKFN